jgi:hypothetical protein
MRSPWPVSGVECLRLTVASNIANLKDESSTKRSGLAGRTHIPLHQAISAEKCINTRSQHRDVFLRANTGN